MRQYIAQSEPDKNGCLSIASTDEKYLTKVLRMKEGSSVDVRHLNGQIDTMKLEKKAGSWILVPAGALGSSESGVKACELCTPLFDFILIQFLPKIQKMDQIVRQSAECGIKEIYPAVSEYTPVKENSERTERWDRIIKEARQQSGSSIPTSIRSADSLEGILAKLKKEETAETVYIVLTEISDESESIYSIIGNRSGKERIVLAVGCEGGFSGNEMSMLKNAGFKPLHLKTNVLRAETAAVYGIAVIQNAVMEKKAWREQE